VTAALPAGIIAAGDGSRLRAGGFAMPKPLVPVAGVPLIESAITNFLAAGVTSLVIIVNDDGRACVERVRMRFPGVDVDFIVKTTVSSLESFFEVNRRLEPGRALISTVDAWCRPADFTRFVEAARTRPAGASVLAVTPFVADEKPVWVSVDGAGRITDLGGPSGMQVTAGIYMLSERARAASPPALGRLREFLRWLLEHGETMYAETIETVVDVDCASDIALAEALAVAGRALHRGGDR
jgi:NDP-sugar pyrophosphorylase family protein